MITLTLKLLFVIISCICLTVGANLLIKGVKTFIPENTIPQPKLDNTFRFLSGMFFSFGFMLIWIIFHIDTTNELNYFIGIIVTFAGMGRLYSRIQIGSAGKQFNRMTVLEILLGISIIVLQYFR